MHRRRNARRPRKPQHPSHLPKYKEDVGVCEHVERELHAAEDIKDDPDHETLLFEDQFSKLIIIEADDGVYRLYLLCPRCSATSLEELYLDKYPSFVGSSMKPKKHYQHVLGWIKTKEIEVVQANQLFRSHALGAAPNRGDHVHICEHCDDWRIALMVQMDDDEVEIAVFANDADLNQPTHLIICPDCVADFDPEELYEFIIPKDWDDEDQEWLNSCHTIYEKAGDFFERMFERLEDEAEDLEDGDFEYEGPALNELILLCDHLKLKTLVDDGNIVPINEDLSPYKVKKTPITWLAACEKCAERTDDPFQAAKKCRKKRIHKWTEIDLVKFCIESVGDEFIFSSGLTIEPMVNVICELLQKPEWFFNLEHPVWVLSKEWAPKFFETNIMPAAQMSEEEIRRASKSGELWQLKMEKHPTTREESIIHENTAVIFDDFQFAVIITAPFPSFGLAGDELTGLEAQTKEAEDHFDMAAANAGGIKFQIVTLPSRGWREFHYLFKDKFAAEELENSIDEDDDFEVDLFEIGETD